MRRPFTASSSSSSSRAPEKILSHSRAVRALFASKLPRGAKLVGVALVYRCDDYTGGTTRFQASLRWLCEQTGFTLNTVIGHMRTLQREGYVRSEPAFARDGTRLANTYFLEVSKFGTPSLVKGAPSDEARAHAKRRAVELEPASAAASRELLAKLAGGHG